MRLHRPLAAFFTTTLFTLFAHADTERVQLSNGATYEGDLVEKVPSGEVRRFEWKDLLAQGPTAHAPSRARR